MFKSLRKIFSVIFAYLIRVSWKVLLKFTQSFKRYVKLPKSAMNKKGAIFKPERSFLWLFKPEIFFLLSERSFLLDSLRGKCPNTEFFLIGIFLYSNWIRTRKNSVFGHFSRSGSYCQMFFIHLSCNKENILMEQLMKEAVARRCSVKRVFWEIS